jgi:hypothetical protein
MRIPAEPIDQRTSMLTGPPLLALLAAGLVAVPFAVSAASAEATDATSK